MAETHVSESQEMEAEAHAPYLKVWAGLAVLTAVEYFYAQIFKDSFGVLVLGLMTLALVKAGMVGWWFMHLKYEGTWVYGFLVPACVLATIIIFALMPDIGLEKFLDEGTAEDEFAAAAPLVPNSRSL